MNEASGLDDDQRVVLPRSAGTMAEQQTGLRGKGQFPPQQPEYEAAESMPPGGGLSPF